MGPAHSRCSIKVHCVPRSGLCSSPLPSSSRWRLRSTTVDPLPPGHTPHPWLGRDRTPQRPRPAHCELQSQPLPLFQLCSSCPPRPGTQDHTSFSEGPGGHSWGSSSSGLTSTPHCSSVTAPCPPPGKVPQGTSADPFSPPPLAATTGDLGDAWSPRPSPSPRATYPRTFIEGTSGLPGIIQELITVKLHQDPPPPKVKGQLGSGPAHL